MPISYVELKNTLPSLKNELEGRHISKICLFCDDVYSFFISKKCSAFISLRNQDPFFYFSKEIDHISPFPNSHIDYLRKELSNCEIKSISLKENDRVLTIDLLGINEIFKEERKTLVLELIPSKANLILVDSDGKVMFTHKPFMDGRLNLKNATYEFPATKPFVQKEVDKLPDFDAKINSLVELRKEEKFKDLLSFLKKRATTSENKIKKISQDLEKAKEHINDNEIGDLILMNLDKIKYKDEYLLIDDMKIRLNPRLKAFENANSYFKASKKAKAAIEQSKGNIERAKKEYENFSRLYNSFVSLPEETCEDLCKEFGLDYSNKKNQKSEHFGLISSSNLPYYCICDDVKILFGKNSKQNDYLSFVEDTSKNHIWMHIVGDSGCHLIIKNDDPSKRIIDIASQIVIHASKHVDGEVLLTKRGNIKKGSKEGEVFTKDFSIIRVNEVSEEAKLLYETATKI